MCIAKGTRIKISKLRLSDVYEMQEWEAHDSPLFGDYNFPKLSNEEVMEWYRIKAGRANKDSFSIRNEENRVIGYMTLKDIKRFRRIGTLGIVFDPKYMNRGYGTETIIAFLNYFFNGLKMKTLNLHVARHNKRAIRCYEKCGFQRVKEYTEKLEDENINIFEDQTFKDVRGDFVSIKGVTYSYFYEMKITKDKYIETYPIALNSNTSTL